MFRRTAFLSIAILILALSGSAEAQRLGGPAADPTNAFEVFGIVTDFTTVYGSGMPTLVVEDPALGTVEVGLGPVWYLQREGFSAATGDEVELLAYPCATCSSPAVAAWVNNRTTDAAIELRDDQGYPLWMHHRGGGGGHPLCDLGEGKPGGPKSGHGDHGSGDGPGDHGHGDGPGDHGPGDGPGDHGPGDGPGDHGPGDGPGDHGPGDGPGDHGPGDGPGDHGPGDHGPGDHGPGDGPGDHGPGDGPGDHGPGDGPGEHGPGDGSRHGGQCDWAAPDMSAVDTASGTVASVSAAAGEGMASMVLATADGELELLLSPYHPIAAAGFLIEPGMALQVTYAPWAVGGETVLATISITDPVTGLVIQLRDPETGYPVHGGPPW